MSAAAADREAKRSDGKLKGHLMAAVRIYKGTLVCHNATGYLAPGADTANFKFAGVSYEAVDNSSGAAGGKTCRAEKSGEYLFTYGPGGATQELLGREVFIVDDSTVTDAGTTNNIKCGAVEHVRVDGCGAGLEVRGSDDGPRRHRAAAADLRNAGGGAGLRDAGDEPADAADQPGAEPDLAPAL